MTHCEVDFSKAEIIWKPTDGKKKKKFWSHISQKYNVKIDDYWDIHKWSVGNIRDFWAEIWDVSGIIHSKRYDEVLAPDAKISESPEWFPGSRLNFAENILRYKDNHVALITAGEERVRNNITYAELNAEARRYGAAFRKLALVKGDHVTCYMPNREQPIYAMLGATSVGAIWSGALPHIGAQAVVNRFTQIQPKFLITTDRFIFDGAVKDLLQRVEQIAADIRSLVKVIIVPSNEESLTKDISSIRNGCFLDEFLSYGVESDGSVPDLEFEQVSFSHPVFINYTSGTTGKPKAIVHGAVGLLSTVRDFAIQQELDRSEVWLSMSPVGWASWNLFTYVLFLGCTLVLFDGVPYFLSPTHLWDIIDDLGITRMLLVPSVLDELEKKGYLPTPKNHLSSLRMILSGGSVVKRRNFLFVRDIIKREIPIISAYGSTEMGIIITVEDSLPAYMEENSPPCLGVNICCYNDKGEQVTGEMGELVITTPTPTFPLFVLGDTDGSVYRDLYCKKYPDVFTANDMCVRNPVTKGFRVYGRSDDTLNQKGARIGCSEIYNVVNAIPEICDSVCVSQYNETGDERTVLFVKMEEGSLFTSDVVASITNAIENDLHKRYMPELILEAKDIPYNMNGKKMEVVVKKIINGMEYNSDTVINPESLEFYHNVQQLKGY